MPVRVTLVANGKHHVAKAVVLPSHDPTLDSIKQAGKNKLRLTVRRLFTKDGIELLSSDDIRRHVTPGSTVVCSNGEEFAGRKVSSGKAISETSRAGVAAIASASAEARVEVLAVETLVDEEAIRQLKRTASSYAAIVAAAGMPDLHPGNSFPIGAAFYVQNQILPFLVGNDVGCGMALWMTSLSSGKATHADRWAKRLETLHAETVEPTEGSDPGDGDCWQSDVVAFSHQLGTIGGGNHFAELQIVEDVLDEEKFSELGLRNDRVFLLVHSGSRGFGQSILEEHTSRHGTAGLDIFSEDGQRYMRRHESACSFARKNREEIARRLLTALQCDFPDHPILDIYHNNVVEFESSGGKVWLHRKGAAPMDQGPIVIPGSRGAFSYLVVPTADESNCDRALCSVAHGAGRKWTRSKANAIGKQRYPRPATLRSSPGGGYVVCNSTALLYEEQPDAYKDITTVIADLTAQGLIHVVAVFKPVLTYKN